MKTAWARFRALFRRTPLDRDLDDEVAAHLDLLERDYQRRGLSPAAARAAARRAFGGVEQMKEQYRDRRSLPVVETTLQDLRYAARTLRKTPIFTIIALLSIALGIGANTAIFTLLDQVLLQLLPVKDPRQLVQLTSQGDHYGNAWGNGDELSYPMFVDLRDHNSSFSGVFGRVSFPLHAGFAGQTERIDGELVSGEYFSVLGLDPVLGRLIGLDDARPPSGQPSVVLSYGYWRARFGGAMDVIGKPIVISNQPMTIVGVAAKGFDGLNLGTATQVFVPITYLETLTPIDNGLTDRRLRWFNVFARLRPGVTPEQAQAALQPFYASRLRMEVDEPGFARASAATKAGFLRGTIGVTLASHGRSDLGDTLREPLWALMAIVGCVLLIACANVANLLLARGSARQREIAVRLALGATRGRIVRQLLIESLVLAVGGALIGMAFARLGASALIEFFHDPADTLTVSADPNLRVLAFTLTIAIATGLLFGLLPARQSTEPALGPTLKNEAGSVIGGSHARLRRALVAVQVGLSLLLLIGAGLFIRSLHNLTTINTGIDSTRLLSFSVDPRLNGYSHSRYHLLRQTLLDRVRATPGVTAAAYASQTLFAGGSWNSSITVEGHTPERDERTISMNNSISPGYFETLGMRLQTGRNFDTHDLLPLPPAAINVPSPQPVAIVNQTFVKRFVHDGQVLGRHIGMGRDPNTPTRTEIIGVVSDAKYDSVRNEIRPQVFYPYRMGSDARLVVYVRTTQAEDAMFETLRRVMHDIDPNLPLYAMERFQARVDRSLSNERLVGSLSTVFGLLATLLAMTGLYGVMAYSVTRRTREIGLRMAMGASVPQVAWLVMRDALTLVAIGVAVGLPAAWFAGRYIESQLYQVQPADPIVMAGAVLGLTVVAAAAGLVPAWRATRVNPVIALRYE